MLYTQITRAMFESCLRDLSRLNDVFGEEKENYIKKTIFQYISISRASSMALCHDILKEY